MSKGLDFGALKKDRSDTDTPIRAPDGTATVAESTKKQTRKRNDYKKKYEQEKSSREQLQKVNTMIQDELNELKTWADAVKKEEKESYELRDEIHRLRVQNNMDKKALNQLALEHERYKFRPQQYSEIAQLLVSMRVRGNAAQKQAVINIVGTTDIVEVRKYIFKLLEEPYNE